MNYPSQYTAAGATRADDKLFPLFLPRNINGAVHVNLRRFNYVFLWRIFRPRVARSVPQIFVSSAFKCTVAEIFNEEKASHKPRHDRVL